MYLPPLHARTVELFRVLWRVLRRPNRLVPVQGTVVVVLDALEEYRTLWTGTCALRRLLLQAALCDVPVVFTRWVRTPSSPDDQLRRKGHWSEFLPRPGTLMPEVRAVAPDAPVVSTVFTDAFRHADFRELVQGYERVVLAGMWTEACVLHTSRSCAMLDVEPIVCADACGGHFPASLTALMTVQSLYGDVVGAVTFEKL
jgi:nicotinamidase-related amidase